MTSKSSSSAAGGGIDKMASVKRIAVVAAVVLLLSMAVVGSVSAYTVTITTTLYDDKGGHGVTYAYSTDGGTTYVAYSAPFDVTADTVVTIKAICSNSIIRPQDWNISSNVKYSSITKDYGIVTFTMPSSAVGVTVTEGKLLPDEYTELEYIESTGTQYIKTGMYSDSTGYVADGKVQFTTGSDHYWNSILGFFDGVGSCAKISRYQGSTRWGLSSGADYSSSATFADGVDYEFEASFIVGNKYLEIDGSKVINNTDSHSIPTNREIFLFTHNRNGGGPMTNEMLYGRLYYVQLYNHTDNSLILTRNYIPAYYSDGDGNKIFGMYDTVQGKFYSNARSGVDFKGGYKVTYNANEGSVTAPTAQYGKSGDYITVSAYNGTKDGGSGATLYFAGWKVGTTEVILFPGQSYILTDNVTLTAQWSGTQAYGVGYNENGATWGTVPVDSGNPHTIGDPVTVSGNTGDLVKTDCAFVGWTCDQELPTTGGTIPAGNLIPGDTVFIMPSGNVTLYAKWVPGTIVTLDNNSGDNDPVPGTVTEIYGSAVAGVTFTTAAARTGYTLDGWYTDSSGGSKILNANGSVVGTVVDGWVDSNGKWVKTDATAKLFAKWVKCEFSITYKDQFNQDFSGVHESGYPETHTYGTATTLDIPTKTGYSFGGWFTTSECTGDPVTELGATDYTSDITLYAKWISASYTFTIPAKITTGDTAVQYTYSITGNAQGLGSGVVQMKLTNAANYDSVNNKFYLKNVADSGSGDMLEYTITKGGSSIIKNSVIVENGLNNPDTVSATLVFTKVNSGETTAGTYEDTLTFELNVIDGVYLKLTGGTWTQGSSTVTSVVVPVGSTINVSGNTVTFTKDSTSVVLTHTATQAMPEIGTADSMREANGATVQVSDRIMHWGLPDGYTEVEYLEGDGNAYINTGFSSPYGFITEMDVFCYNKGLCPSMSLIGSHYETNQPWGRNTISTSYKVAEGIDIGAGGCTVFKTNNADFSKKFTIKASTVVGDIWLKIDDVNQSLEPWYEPSDTRCDYSLWLFSSSGHAANAFDGKIYYCKIWDNTGNLVRNFVPVVYHYGEDDDVAGMYDICGSICQSTGTPFYTNAGSGTFTAGPEVE